MIRRITFRADEEAITGAREQAARDGRSLNDAFREWLEWYSAKASRANAAREYEELMAELRPTVRMRHFTREALHER